MDIEGSSEDTMSWAEADVPAEGTAHQDPQRESPSVLHPPAKTERGEYPALQT